MNCLEKIVICISAISLSLLLSIPLLAGGDPLFMLRILDVPASPGQEILVPVIISNEYKIGAWEILVSYDTGGGDVTGVELHDSVQAIDPRGDTLAWFYAAWAGHPELMPEVVNDNIQGNQVRVTGFMDNYQLPIVPPLSTGHDQLLFCLTFDVISRGIGDSISFLFQTDDCTDNTLTDSGGTVLWFPDTFSVPDWIFPNIPISQKVIRLVDLTSGVEDMSSTPVVPGEFALLQNYPNPFNPVTTIEYFLPRSCQVRLEVFDLLGRWVATLVDDPQPAGLRKVQWPASGHPSGVYFCRLQAENYQETMKMTLLK